MKRKRNASREKNLDKRCERWRDFTVIELVCASSSAGMRAAGAWSRS